MIHIKTAAQNFVADPYERDSGMIFRFLKVAQNIVAEHYVRDFDMIFHHKAAQNLVAEVILT